MAGMKQSKLAEFVGDDYQEILNHPILIDNEDLSAAIEAMLESESLQFFLGNPNNHVTGMKLILIITYYKGFLAGKETKSLEENLGNGSPDLS